MAGGVADVARNEVIEVQRKAFIFRLFQSCVVSGMGFRFERFVRYSATAVNSRSCSDWLFLITANYLNVFECVQ